MRARHSMPEALRLVTADELEKFPRDDSHYELVQGRLVPMSPVGYQHGLVALGFGALLRAHVRSRNLGVVVTEVGFTLGSNPDTVRAPDIAFIRRDRIPSTDPRGFWKGPPDLAIEVLSPDDRPTDVQRKVDDYLARGVPVVLIVDADERTVTVHRPLSPPTTLASLDSLDIGDVVSGFRCKVQEIFE